MKTHRRIFPLLVAAALLAACATGPTGATLTYETSPEGATIFEGNQSLGAAPVTRTYTGDGKSQSITTPEVTAVWPSGAKQSYWTRLPAGADRVATIERPKSAPGLQADLDNAKKFALAREQDAARDKDAIARDMARGSARCKAQAGNPNRPVDDCN